MNSFTAPALVDSTGTPAAIASAAVIPGEEVYIFLFKDNEIIIPQNSMGLEKTAHQYQQYKFKPK